MDLTQGTLEEKKARAKKMMLWFGMVSLSMTFAGLTSAYVISRNRPDWANDIKFPNAFIFSTIAILLSSVTFYLAKKVVGKNEPKKAMVLLITTLLLAITFVVCQYMGFAQLIENGFNPTGPTSTITTSLWFAIIFMHILHVFAGILVLLIVIYNHSRQKYKIGQTLGLELGAMFWHFLDFLWVYLFLFLYLIR